MVKRKYFRAAIFLTVGVGAIGLSSLPIASEAGGKPCEFKMIGTGVFSVERLDDDSATFFFLSSSSTTQRLSPICIFEGVSSNGNASGKESYHIIFRGITTPYRPYIGLWSDERNEWVRIPSIMNRSNRTVSADIPQSVIAAVFVDTRDSYAGVASWYAHRRHPNGAATNLFPLGTKVKITNAETGKNIVATITSTWTQKDPKRVVDIVSTGFRKLASLSTGLIRVTIEKL